MNINVSVHLGPRGSRGCAPADAARLLERTRRLIVELRQLGLDVKAGVEVNGLGHEGGLADDPVAIPLEWRNAIRDIENLGQA